MAEQWWISYSEEKVGNRPTRRIYTLTEIGEVKFQEMLISCLGQYEPAEYTSSVCLAFLDTLPHEEVLPLLKNRLATIEELIASMKSNQSHQGAFQLTIDHQIRHLVTDLEWISELISHLESPDWGNELDLKFHPLPQES